MVRLFILSYSSSKLNEYSNDKIYKTKFKAVCSFKVCSYKKDYDLYLPITNMFKLYFLLSVFLH